MLGAATTAAAQPCAMADAGSGTVRAVLDGRTVMLTDGREIRLAAIEAPDTAKAALEKLVGGREIALKRAGDDADRHGRIVAYAFARGSDNTAQHALIAGGQARVSSRVGDAACAAALLAAERAARAARLGLWSDAAYAPRPAADVAALNAERGRFTLVEGRVVSVRESGGTIYVNFSRRWSEDFTVTVRKRDERAFTAAGVDLKKLAGRGVRVRGFIEERGGPWIEASRPEQIETLGSN